MNNSAEQRNFFEFSRDFIMSHVDTIADNINACREQPNTKEINNCYLRIAGSAAILLTVFGVTAFLLYHAFTLIVMGINFLRANEPLGVIVGSLVLIYILALIINSFMKKPKGKTEREQDAEKMKLGSDLLKAFQDLSPKYGIERPDGISDIFEEMIMDELRRYKDNFSEEEAKIEQVNIESLEKEIADSEAALKKFQSALTKVNDGYDLGDYEREEWLERKKKWEDRIKETRDGIYELKKKLTAVPVISSAMRKANIDAFFDRIATTASNEELNDLYKTIIESITWLKDGKNISLTVNYR